MDDLVIAQGLADGQREITVSVQVNDCRGCRTAVGKRFFKQERLAGSRTAAGNGQIQGGRYHTDHGLHPFISNQLLPVLIPAALPLAGLRPSSLGAPAYGGKFKPLEVMNNMIGIAAAMSAGADDSDTHN